VCSVIQHTSLCYKNHKSCVVFTQVLCCFFHKINLFLQYETMIKITVPLLPFPLFTFPPVSFPWCSSTYFMEDSDESSGCWARLMSTNGAGATPPPPFERQQLSRWLYASVNSILKTIKINGECTCMVYEEIRDCRRVSGSSLLDVNIPTVCVDARRPVINKRRSYHASVVVRLSQVILQKCFLMQHSFAYNGFPWGLLPPDLHTQLYSPKHGRYKI